MPQSAIGHLVYFIDAKNIPFYRDLLSFLGWSVLYEGDAMLGLTGPHDVSLWFGAALKDLTTDFDARGLNHVALSVPAQGDIDATVDYLKTHGVPSLFETPRHRPDFTQDPAQTYYQVMFVSPDNIQFEVVYIGPKA